MKHPKAIPALWEEDFLAKTMGSIIDMQKTYAIKHWQINDQCQNVSINLIEENSNKWTY